MAIKTFPSSPRYLLRPFYAAQLASRFLPQPMFHAAVAAVADDSAADAANAEVTVTLTDVGGTKVAVIKAVREITGLGLVDAKGLVDKAPSVIKENVSPEEAEEIKKKLMDAGASVEVK